MILAAIIAAGSGAAAFAGKFIAEGKSFTPVGSYRIELSDKHFTMKGENCRTYIIKYENSPMEVTVAVRNEQNCRRYLVLSDKLSVQYVCKSNLFGVKKLGKEFAKDGLVTEPGEINMNEYLHQKVISRGTWSEVEAAQLIASYFPMLFNDIDDVMALK